MKNALCILCGYEGSPKDFLKRCCCPSCGNALTQREVDNMYSLIEEGKSYETIKEF